MASSRGGVATLLVVVRPWLLIFLLLAGTRAALVDVSTEASEKSRTQLPRSAVNTTEGPQHSEKPLMTESVSPTSKRNDDEKGTTDNFESTTTEEWPVIEMVSTDSSSTSPRNEVGNESEWPKVEDEFPTSDVAPETNNTTVISLVSSQDSVSTTKKLPIFQKLALYNVPKVDKSGKNTPFRSRRHPPATRQPEPVRDPSKYRYTTFLDGDYVSTSETDTSSSFSPTAPLYDTTTSPQVETTESYRQESDDERSEKSEARFDVPRDELSTVLTTSVSAESQEERTDLTSECSIDECGVESTSASSVTTTDSPATSCGDAGSTCASDGSPRNDTETTTAVAGTAEMPWPVKMAAELPGDLILGGLMMVHEREESVTCGPVMPQGGVQALEAMLFTLDVLNAEPALIPNVTLGAHILDDCDKDTYGLEMAVDFIKDMTVRHRHYHQKKECQREEETYATVNYKENDQRELNCLFNRSCQRSLKAMLVEKVVQLPWTKTEYNFPPEYSIAATVHCNIAFD
ncbi:Metabotropic glutamate receptor [Gryllus bimaculatus]|nr:Metabotropic glutamate receptor [Gryllus bimaculatus]